ncbi:Dicer-like protein 1, partial [Orchesella cincta]
MDSICGDGNISSNTLGMSDSTPPSNISSTAFADALARARQLAAKLSGGATAASPPPVAVPVKRSADDFGS